MHKCPKPYWQGFRSPQNQGNAHFNFNFQCISAPNHPGKGFRPAQNQANTRLSLENPGGPKYSSHEFQRGFPKYVLTLFSLTLVVIIVCSEAFFQNTHVKHLEESFWGYIHIHIHICTYTCKYLIISAFFRA